MATSRKQGKALTEFFENISGSDVFRQECERLEREKGKAEEKARLVFTQKKCLQVPSIMLVFPESPT